jgi:hypothetical protein
VKFKLNLLKGDEADDQPGIEIECDWGEIPKHGDYLDYSAGYDSMKAYVVVARWWEINTGKATVIAREIA